MRGMIKEKERRESAIADDADVPVDASSGMEDAAAEMQRSIDELHSPHVDWESFRWADSGLERIKRAYFHISPATRSH